jgi:SAM-dependent methyltransferase
MAFDSLAPTYDQDFTASPIARYLRRRVHARLVRHFHADDQVLELGCGTGEDALFLANQGIRVTATDASEKMLETTRAKTAGNPLVRVERLDLTAITAYSPLTGGVENTYHGVFANFGVLNCLSDWRVLAGWLTQRTKPGGIAAFGVMSPLCLWEMTWHGLHGDLRTATRRLRKTARFQPDLSLEATLIAYPTVRRLSRDFAPYFKRIHVEGLGLFLPPSDVFGVIEKRPRLLNRLITLEARFAPLPAFASFADHYWIEFQRMALPETI